MRFALAMALALLALATPAAAQTPPPDERAAAQAFADAMARFNDAADALPEPDLEADGCERLIAGVPARRAGAGSW